MKKNILFILLAVFLTSSIAHSQVSQNAKHRDKKEPAEVTVRYNDLLQKYVSKDGKVDYKLLLQDESWNKLVIDHNALIPQEKWSDDRLKSYWMNSYNINTIDLILKNYPLKSINDLDKPWDTKFITIGDQQYSLNDIEHNILRKIFVDPRIHFGINCASFSCPNILNRAFYPNTVDIMLEKSTFAFMSDGDKNEISEKKIKISKIFEWFAEDFQKGNSSVIQFINNYTDTEIKEDAKVEFMDYDWSLNSK